MSGKIAWFFDGWYLTNTGVGVGCYASRLLNAFIRHPPAIPVTIRIMVPDWLDLQSLPSALLPCIQPVAALHTGNEMVDRTAWQNRLSHSICRSMPAPSLFSPGPFWAVTAPRQTAVTYHDRIYRHFPRYKGRLFVRRWLLEHAEQFLRRCRWIFTESAFAKQDLAAIPGVDPARIHVIPAWLPPEYQPESDSRPAEELRVRYHLPHRFWLYVGGYDYRKNVEFLIHAYAAVAQHADCPTLVLAGHIPRNVTQPVCDVFGALKTARLSNGQVMMPGFIRNEDMPALFGAAELLVYPSLCEGFGLPPLEAMGCGCPAIAADNSSLPEVVKDRSYRFNALCPDELVSLLQRARQERLPLNPSFRREDFNEECAIAAYWRLLRTPD